MNKELAKEWLLSAMSDLKSIEHIIDDEFLTHMVAFHAQQSVEKSLKALLEYQSKRVPKEHSTLTLYAMAEDCFDEPLDKGMLTDCDDLYIEARYPVDLGLLPNGKPSKRDAVEFHEFAEKVFAYACEYTGIGDLIPDEG
jgi:HEPN domain-containing protein